MPLAKLDEPSARIINEAKYFSPFKMDEANIETRPLWKPMHLQPVFEGSPFYGDGTSEVLFDKGLCLPSGSSLSDGDIMRVVQVIKDM